FLGCAIPDIPNANITRTNGKHTDKLKHGENDYYEGYYLNYDDDDGEYISPPTRLIHKIVNCTDGVLSDYTLVCDDVDTSDTAVTKEGCTTVQNGIVTDNGQSVECNEGYVNAHSLLYERYSCSCHRDIPALVCNGRKAKCNAVNCTLDSYIKQGMTLKYRGRFVTASSMEAIAHGKFVDFNCEIGANNIKYEPRNRRFRCDRGKWLEANRRGDSWSLGNNGTFPKCRPAKCECQNGGTCIRDKHCECPPHST
ncbi:hypothetical protein MAR_033696, partial [Mya arenaria]